MSVKATDKKIKSVVSQYENDPQKAIKELKKLLKEGQENNDSVLIGEVYNAIAARYDDLEDYENLFSTSLRAVAFLEKTDDWEGLAIAYNNVGYGYSLQENSQMSLAYSYKAYQLMKRHRHYIGNRLTLINNLSTSYHEMGDCKTAIKLVLECIDLLKQDDPENYIELAMYTINLAQFHRDDGDTAKAMEILDSMLEWLDKVEFNGLVCDYYLRRAGLEYEMGKKREGDKSMDKAFANVPDNMYPLPIYDDLRELEYVIIRNGDKKRGKKIADLMETFAKKSKGKFEKFIALRTLADYYHNIGESAKAAELYIQVDHLYEERMKEMKAAQFRINKMMQEADDEIQRLNRKMERELKIASCEPMTGLLNRSALLRTAEEFIATARKKKEKVGAIFIDIDFFKECNDTYGHAKGDEIIKKIARICKKEEKRNIRFARYGGDEYFGLTHGLSDEEVAAIAGRICKAVRSEKIPNKKNPNGGVVTVSGGVANVAITEQIDTIIEIANYADKAVYYAKNAGKDAAFLLDHERSKTTFIKIEA